MRSFLFQSHITGSTHHHRAKRKQSSHSDSELSPTYPDYSVLLPRDATIQDYIESRLKTELVHFMIFDDDQDKDKRDDFIERFTTLRVALQKKIDYITQILEFDSYYKQVMNKLILRMPDCCENINEMIEVVIPLFISYEFRDEIELEFVEAIGKYFFKNITFEQFTRLLSHNFRNISMMDLFLRTSCDTQYFARELFKKIDYFLRKDKYTDFETIKMMINHYNKNASRSFRHDVPIISILSRLLNKGQNPSDILALLNEYLPPHEHGKDHRYLGFLIQLYEKNADKSAIVKCINDLLDKFSTNNLRDIRDGHSGHGLAFGSEWREIFYTLAKLGILPEKFNYKDTAGEIVFKYITLSLPQDERNTILHAIRNHDDIPLNRLFWRPPSPALFTSKELELPKHWQKKIDSLLDGKVAVLPEKQTAKPKH